MTAIKLPRGRTLHLDDPIVMGILNATPDSFSDGGNYCQLDSAVKQAQALLNQGAKIIDIGGESTRPGADFVSADEELKRIIPVIKAIKLEFNVLISVDTYKSIVAEQAIIAGADIINDVWGNRYDGKMIDVICKYNVPYIWMHNQDNSDYINIISDIKNDFINFYRLLESRNYSMHKLYFDPGIGFGKTPEQNLYLLANLDQFTDLDCKKLLGTSRKSVYKYALNIENTTDRDFPTALTSFDAVRHNFDIIRVHNVKLNHDAVNFAWALKGVNDECNR